MPILPSPENLWLYVAAIAALLVLGCLRAIGCEYDRAVRWHNLRIEVHNLRLEQQRKKRAIERGEAAAGGCDVVGEPKAAPPIEGDVEILDEPDEVVAAEAPLAQAA
jgi:hypothetical protein